jgi:hypothetical protein
MALDRLLEKRIEQIADELESLQLTANLITAATYFQDAMALEPDEIISIVSSFVAYATNNRDFLSQAISSKSSEIEEMLRDFM